MTDDVVALVLAVVLIVYLVARCSSRSGSDDGVAAALRSSSLLLVAAYRPLGDYMAWALTSPRPLRVERAMLPPGGVNPTPSSGGSRTRHRCSCSRCCRCSSCTSCSGPRRRCPSRSGVPGVRPSQAFNTATSFVSNTNWQSYAGESTMGHLVQMDGLAVQNFVSAAVGIAVAVALIRGFTRVGAETIGNFWADLVRTTVRVLLPIAFVGAIVLVSQGVVQNLHGSREVTTVQGGAAVDPGRTGRLAGGDQGARDERRRLLQRELSAPVREPESVHEPARDLPAARDPLRPHGHVRQARRATAGRGTRSRP